VRTIAGAALVLVAGAHVVRSAVAETEGFASAYADDVAASHPEVILADAMTEVGEAAARGEDPPAPTLAALERLTHQRPLAAEPFLVHGAMALRQGDAARAERLLLEARRRSPRSPAARYLLADLYLRTDRPLPAMAEMSVLNRLLPRGSVQLAPALAAYAAMPGAERHLGAIVAAYPEVGPRLLEELASDPANVDLVLSLAARSPVASTRGDWQRRLLQTLVDRGDYARARQVWERLTGARLPEAGLVNPQFAASDAPPPFNWHFTKNRGGVAEARGGSLQLLYYGREDLVLAAQTLLLPPGRYRLAMTVSGAVGDPGGLRWTVTCVGSEQKLLDLALPTGGGSRPASGDFAVPAGCRAQRLQLQAVGREFPKEANAQISAMQLTRAE
jgi:tetratricopeptide (TPR) repeat protein